MSKKLGGDKMIKKCSSIILAFALLLSVFATTASAAETTTNINAETSLSVVYDNSYYFQMSAYGGSDSSSSVKKTSYDGSAKVHFHYIENPSSVYNLYYRIRDTSTGDMASYLYEIPANQTSSMYQNMTYYNNYGYVNKYYYLKMQTDSSSSWYAYVGGSWEP